LKKISTGQIIANIITGLVLVGLMVFVVVSYILDPAKYGEGVTKGLVAFTTTFIILLVVTASIYLIKAITERFSGNGSSAKSTGLTSQNKGKSDKLMAAVIAAAINQFQFDSNGQIAVGFKVRELFDVNTPWTTFSKNDYHKSGGSR
jgi:Na+-transporting methylmalonyl-CoA/oxaloacetate decarboxylase gamma subunit